MAVMPTPAAPPRVARRPARRARPRVALRPWQREVVLYLAVYLLYGIGRWLAVGDATTALANARAVVELQTALGVAVEADVQRALLGTWAIPVLNALYLVAEFVVLPAALVVLYRRARPLYVRLRSTVLVTWLLALPVFALLPTAPPRLAGTGLVDTISREGALALDDRVTTQFYNPYAAIPSLHCGFALAVGIALAASTRRPLLRALALTWPVLVALSTVATGNHFVVDVLAGFAATGLGLALVTLAARRA